mmetsp:Transcript_17240/g.56417  ORF Transcript_17240/g.56417 Transcript_17240/m.56417 type:complete len:163 (-) Transcript_17240:800-1288(-)
MGGRGRGRGGGKSDRNKKLHRESKSERKKRRTEAKGGLVRLLWGFGALLGLVAVASVREEQASREETRKVQRRLASKPIVVTPHAECRAECRFVSQEEVMSTLDPSEAKVRLNKRKSTPQAQPCAKYALDNGRVQAIWAACDRDSRLITVIDTVIDHECPAC